MKKLFTLVLTVAISFSMLYAQKHLQKAPNLPPKLDVHSPAFSTGDTVVVSDLYYVINTEKKTAKLTYQDKTSHNYEGLSSIVIPSRVYINNVTYTVTSIGERAFAFCPTLSHVTIGESITSIADYAFYECSEMTSITIPENITSIGKYVFYKTAISSVQWNAVSCSVPAPSDYIYPVFLGCEKTLSSITFGDKVNKIPSYIAFEMPKVTSIIIPNSVKSIGSGAFSGSGISSITIPNSVTSLSYGVFSDCNGLTAITIPNSISTISFALFMDCKNLISVTLPSTIKTLEGQAFLRCEKLQSINIPNNVTTISYLCFYQCHSLKSVFIPQNVIDIDPYAFDYCIGMTAIDVDKQNPNYSSLDGVLFNKNKSELIRCPGGKQGVYTIPNRVATIGYSAFSGCTELSVIEIPQSVTTIQAQAFNDCKELKALINYAVSPQPLDKEDEYMLHNVDTATCILYVPSQSTLLYSKADVWKSFANIKPIAAAKEDVSSSVQVTPDYTSVTVTWPQVTDADNYEITVNDNNNNVVCILRFNASGELVSISPNAQQPRKSLAQTQETGFEFTIIGLEPGTDYNYTVIAKNSADNTIDTKTGSFTTIANVEISDAAITVKLDPKSSLYWSASSIYLWAWTSEENLFAAWPGVEVTKDLEGWYSYTFDKTVTDVNIIWSGGNTQTVDIMNITESTCFTPDGFYNNKATCARVDCPDPDDNLYSYIRVGDVFYNFNSANQVAEVVQERGSGCNYSFQPLSSQEQPISSLTIPATVDYNGVTHTVTKVAAYALASCCYLNSISLPNTIMTIGDYGFNSSQALTSIICEAVTPPTCGQDVFGGIDKSTCKLYVPSESVEAYKAADKWKDFATNIKAITDIISSNDIVVEMPSLSTRKFLKDGQLFIQRGDKTYTVTGQEVK